jgi:hypothetical protein
MMRKLQIWLRVKLSVKQEKKELVTLFKRLSVHFGQTMSTPLEVWIVVTLADLQTSQGEKIIQ